MLASISDVVTSQVGGLQDPCTAGGALCPQPNSAGASFNPCCYSSAASSHPTYDVNGDVVPLEASSNPLDGLFTTPTWVYIIGASVLGLILFEVTR